MINSSSKRALTAGTTTASRGRGHRLRAGVITLGVVAALGLSAPLAFATHYEASLEGSDFQIDNDANFTVEADPDATLDWNNVAEDSKTDAPTGQGDDSYKGGVKEDTQCPDVTTGSIPNNKSDLKSFGIYVEEGSGAVGDAGFLHLYWTRVSDPSGTTLMDFEFNQSDQTCTIGVNKVRTLDDFLIEYSIDQGGARADITIRKWTGTAWGPAVEFDPTEATGTINSSTILAANTGGVSTEDLQARTFGEASIDLDVLFEADKCTSFGSAMLKSRSSDSFTSQLKDYIAPLPINLSNCAKVIIHKQTDPDGATTLFDYTKSFGTDPATGDTFDLADDETQTFDNVLLGTGYTVVEEAVPAGWVFDSVDCSASVGVTAGIAGATVTFDLDSITDVLECTYFNDQQLGAIEITKTRKHAAAGGDDAHAGVTFTVTGTGVSEEVVTDAEGKACVDGLLFGDYSVTETVPAGYVSDDSVKEVTVDQNASCTTGTPEAVAFVNTPLTNVTVSVDSQVDGGTASVISCTDSEGNVSGGSTGADGDGSVTVSDLLPTDPAVTLTCTVVVDP